MKTLGGSCRVGAAACIVLAMLLCASPSHAGRGNSGKGGHGGGHKSGKLHHRGGGAVFVGVGPWWGGPPLWYARPPYWLGQPVVAEEWVEFIQQQEPSAYWYYCEDPPGYYPSVQRCLAEWLRVLPEPPR